MSFERSGLTDEQYVPLGMTLLGVQVSPTTTADLITSPLSFFNYYSNRKLLLRDQNF